jgi:hypothetical protein
MTGYALVENGEVVSTMDSLPEKFNNISGFNKLSPAEIKSHGFYPYSYVAPSYDGFTQQLGNFSFTIGSNSVTGTREVIALSADDMAAQKASAAANALSLLNKISYDTDWIHLSDNGLSADELANYVALRTSINTAKGLLSGMTGVALQNLIFDLRSNSEDTNARLLVFSSSLIALKAIIDAIGA